MKLSSGIIVNFSLSNMMLRDPLQYKAFVIKSTLMRNLGKCGEGGAFNKEMYMFFCFTRRLPFGLMFLNKIKKCF